MLQEILHTWKYGMLADDQILEIFSKISRLEMTVVDEALITKAALINQFCSEVVASGLVIPADQMSAEECYEVISYQAKSKVQVYTFMKLLFGNPNIDTETKMKFMRGLQRLDAEGIKDLDDILDRQGGFTQQAAERHRKDFGGYEDRDAILELGCLAMLPQIDHKKKMFDDFLNQIGFSVKSLAEAGKYIYIGLTQAQKEELAQTYYQNIERVFEDLHRDYAECVFRTLSPAFLGRQDDEDR